MDNVSETQCGTVVSMSGPLVSVKTPFGAGLNELGGLANCP
jgi:hypothetical protein